jgi:hypothetical protein
MANPARPLADKRQLLAPMCCGDGGRIRRVIRPIPRMFWVEGNQQIEGVELKRISVVLIQAAPLPFNLSLTFP